MSQENDNVYHFSQQWKFNATETQVIITARCNKEHDIVMNPGYHLRILTLSLKDGLILKFVNVEVTLTVALSENLPCSRG